MAHQIFRTLHLYNVCVLGRLSPSSLKIGSRQFCHYNAHCSSEITGRREVGGMACRDQRLYCCICSIRSLFSLLPHIQSTPVLISVGPDGWTNVLSSQSLGSVMVALDLPKQTFYITLIFLFPLLRCDSSSKCLNLNV